MYGDSLKQAINEINKYIQSGNTIYLWKEKDFDNILKIEEDDKLEFALVSKVPTVCE